VSFGFPTRAPRSEAWKPLTNGDPEVSAMVMSHLYGPLGSQQSIWTLSMTEERPRFWIRTFVGTWSRFGFVGIATTPWIGSMSWTATKDGRRTTDEQLTGFAVAI
jgi:hypothetical protein